VPDVRSVDTVEHQVIQTYWVNCVVPLAPINDPDFQGFKLLGGSDVLVVWPGHWFEGLGQESGAAGARVVHRLANLGVHYAHHSEDARDRLLQKPSGR
jgi:hypothetical protein